MDIRVKLNNVRLSFADLFEARPQGEKQELKFGCDALLIPGSSVTRKIGEGAAAKWVPTTLEEVMLEAAADKLQDKAKNWFAALEATKKLYRGPGRVTANGDPYADYVDLMYVTCKNKARPQLYGPSKQVVVASSEGFLYSGCFANVIVDVYAMTNDPKKKGVFGKLMSAQHVRDGDAFSNSSVASADDFDDIGEGADAEAMA